MNGITAIKTALEMTRNDLLMFIDDFTDADLFVRPVPNANHTAWHLGHLIVGDSFLVKSELPDAVFPEQPADFGKNYEKEGSKLDGPAGFLTKAEYVKLFTETRNAAISALEKLIDADLDRKSTGMMKDFCPTFGHLFLLISNHTHMHMGQITVIRRKLGKPVLF